MTQMWFIYHIPKTGGQTVRDHLNDELVRGVDFQHLGKWDLETPLEYDDLATLDDEARSRLRILIGHPLERRYAELFPGRPIREVVFIRDPASRLVSHYNFNMTMLSRRGKPRIEFEQFLDQRPDNFMTGLLARYFGTKKQAKRLSEVLHELSHVWLVGRTESMDTILPHLFAAMGLPPRLPDRTNVTGVTIDRWITLTPDLADELHRRNPVDSMLYSSVARLEHRCLERMGVVQEPVPVEPIGFRTL